MGEHGAGNDGCEWNPDADRWVKSNETHYLEAPATVMLGAGHNMVRLCESCSRLPRFSRLRKRVPIMRQQCPHPSRQPHGRHEWYTGGGCIHTGTLDDMYCRACGKVQPNGLEVVGAKR